MRLHRPRLLTRPVRRHAERSPSQFENPSKNWEFIRHMNSPWALISLWLFQIIILILIMVQFGYQREFSDYLNQRGDYADRSRIEERKAVCDLIADLYADPSGQLNQLAKRLGCAKGPLPRPSSSPNSSSSVPIGPTGTFSTGNPTPGSRTPTGATTDRHGGGNGALGTNVPAPTSTPDRPTDDQVTEPPPSTSSPVPSGGSPSPPPPSPQLCVPLTDLCLSF